MQLASRPCVRGPSHCRGFPKADDRGLTWRGWPALGPQAFSVNGAQPRGQLVPDASRRGRQPSASTSWGLGTAAPDGADATAC